MTYLDGAFLVSDGGNDRHVIRRVARILKQKSQAAEKGWYCTKKYYTLLEYKVIYISIQVDVSVFQGSLRRYGIHIVI